MDWSLTGVWLKYLLLMYTPLFVIALHLYYKHAAWAVPGAGARPLIWKFIPSWQLCVMLLGRWGARGFMDGKRSTLHGVDAVVPATGCRRKPHWGKMDPLILQHPQFSTHFAEGLALEPTAQSTFHCGTWQLAPMLMALKYLHCEGSGTTQLLQIPGALQQGPRNTSACE